MGLRTDGPLEYGLVTHLVIYSSSYLVYYVFSCSNILLLSEVMEQFL